MKLETVEGLVEMVEELKKSNIDPTTFITELNDAKSVSHWFKEFTMGRITAQQYKRRTGVYL